MKFTFSTAAHLSAFSALMKRTNGLNTRFLTELLATA